MTKRRYTGGYHFDWNKSYSHVPLRKHQPKENYPVTASVEKEIVIPLKEYEFVMAPDSAKCDEIILTNGNYIKGIVQEIGVNEIKYKDCDNLSGPVIDVSKSTVLVIQYANGKRSIISSSSINSPEKEKTELSLDVINKFSNAMANTNKPKDNSAMVLGVILIVGGIVVLVFVSILIGVILMVLGVVLCVI